MTNIVHTSDLHDDSFNAAYNTSYRDLFDGFNTLLITGGEIDIAFAREYVKRYDFQNIIAVDGGLERTAALNLMPDYIVGDFDTISTEILKRYETWGRDKDSGKDKYCAEKIIKNADGQCDRTKEKRENQKIKIIRYNPEKDFTDTESAVKLAVDIGSKRIHILGGIGSRLDHTMANIQLLQIALEKDIDTVIVNENNRIRLLGMHSGMKSDKNSDKENRKSITIERDWLNYQYVSLLPLTEKVTDVTIEGMKYGLNHYDFNIFENISMGVSNEIVGKQAEISVGEGVMVVIESRD